ncbi:MAG: tetratricopeptide repeat protein [Streptosporangiaceae bacterium]
MADQAQLASLLEQGDSKTQAGDVQGAIETYDDLLTLAPGHLDALERKATALVTIGEMEAGLACCTELVNLDPRTASRYVVRARMLSYMNRYPDAIDDFQRAIALGGESDASLLRELGLCLQEAGRSDEAIETYQRAINLDRGNPELQVALGDALLDAGRVDAAVAAFNSAGDVGKPGFTDIAWTTRGNRMRTADRNADAIVMYRAALGIRPTVEAWRGIAQAYLAERQYDDVIAATEAALKLAEDDTDAWNVRGCAYFETGRMPQALECFDAVTRKQPDSALGWSNRAVTLYILEQTRDAVAAIQRSIELSPTESLPWAALSEYQQSLGENEAALEAADQCLKLNENFVAGMICRALALRSLGRLEEALSMCDHIHEINRTEVASWHIKALVLADLGREADATATFDQARSAVALPQESLRAKAVMLSDMFGRHAEALAVVQEAFQMAPRDDRIASDYAELLIKNGRYEEGRVLSAEVAGRETAPSRICAMRFMIFVSYVLAGDISASENAFDSFIEFYIRNFLTYERRLNWTYDGLRAVVRSGAFPRLRRFTIETFIDVQEGRIPAKDVSYLSREMDGAQGGATL